MAPPFAAQWSFLQREVDAVLQRLLRRPLQAHVQRQPERVTGSRLLAQNEVRLLASE